MEFEPENEYNIQPDAEELNRKPAETPWYSSYTKLADDGYYQVVYNHQGIIARFDWMPVKISETTTATNRASNAAHVVKCVNNFDQMKGLIDSLNEPEVLANLPYHIRLRLKKLLESIK